MNNLNNFLDDAISLAVETYKGHRQEGKPFILHLLRVMLSVDTDELRVVALLHTLLDMGKHTNEVQREMIASGDPFFSRGFIDDRIIRRKFIEMALPFSIVEAIEYCSGRGSEETTSDSIDFITKNYMASVVKLAAVDDVFNNISADMKDSYTESYHELRGRIVKRLPQPQPIDYTPITKESYAKLLRDLKIDGKIAWP